MYRPLRRACVDLISRIGFGGILYYNYNQERPKPTSPRRLLGWLETVLAPVAAFASAVRASGVEGL